MLLSSAVHPDAYEDLWVIGDDSRQHLERYFGICGPQNAVKQSYIFLSCCRVINLEAYVMEGKEDLMIRHQLVTVIDIGWTVIH